ncbi:MAG: hypothetical protein WCI75_09240 [candidate division NC10 bacterium]
MSDKKRIFIQTLRRPRTARSAQVTAQVTAQVEPGQKIPVGRALRALAEALGISTAQVTAQVVRVLEAASSGVMSRGELQAAAKMTHREHFRRAYIEPLVTAGSLERTISDKPTSRLQEYRLTAKGRAWLASRTP